MTFPYLKYLDEMHAALGMSGLERLETMLRDLAQGSAPPPTSKLNHAHLLHFPFLEHVPWYDPARFSWVPSMEAAAEEIGQEFLALESSGVGEKIDYMGGGAYGGVEGKWTAWILHADGAPDPVNAARCPTTLAKLGEARLSLGDCMYSEFHPHTVLPMHSGGVDAVLSCHLPILLTPDCGIRVGMIARTWQPTKVMMFGDSWLHMAWNEADTRRVVLVFEVWHPDLTDREIEGSRFVMERVFEDCD